jgi:23S rRNA-/tRNA-specific pseudouridylate synthase
MVLAKNEFAYKNLKDQFRYHTVTKIYHALVEGNIGEIYNIGADSEAEYTVMEIAEILVKFIN